LVETLCERLLPTFNDTRLEEEARLKVEEEWQKLSSSQAGEDIPDMADLAERASDTGLDYYVMITGLRQGIQNMFAVALYHLYEQQAMYFLRNELLPREEQDVAKFLTFCELRKRMFDFGIDLRSFKCKPTILELSLLANTVKHADGKSSADLRVLRPGLFMSPMLERMGFRQTSSPPPVFTPLMGEDVYVSVDDLRRYADGVIDFWQELSDAISPA